MNVEPPVYIEDKGSYSFFLTDSPSFLLTIPWPSVDAPLESYVQTDTNLFQSQLVELAKHFLEKTSEYFTNPLLLQGFLDGLHHTWTDPYGLLREARDSSSTMVQVQWTPIQLFLGIDSYQLIWALYRLDPGEEPVPEVLEEQQQEEEEEEEQEEGQEEQGGVPEEEYYSEQAEEYEDQEEEEEHPLSDSTPASFEPSLEQVDLSELPCMDAVLEDTSNAPSVIRARDRRLIRETRLRADLLQLRAERLAQRYLEKYATAQETDTESALSFSSDSD